MSSGLSHNNEYHYFSFFPSNINPAQPFHPAEKNQTRSCCFGPKVNSSCVLTTGLGVGVGDGGWGLGAGGRLRFFGEVAEFADTVRMG